MITALIQSIQDSILKQDTLRPLFHGSWDWHSAVHGHWALLHYSRIENNEDLVSWLYNRFDSDALMQELQFLRGNEEFEFPYGRAWLLAFAIAYNKADISIDITKEVNELASDLWNRFNKRDSNVQIDEYDNQCWVLLQLYMWYSFQSNQSMMTAIEDRVSQQYCAVQVRLSDDFQRTEFFSCWGLQGLLIGEVLGKVALKDWLRRQLISSRDRSVLPLGDTVHQLGLHASRAWGFWAAWKATDELFWKEAYSLHVQESCKLHEIWKEDHYSYGHWVPQFSIYAIYIDSIHSII